MSDHVILLSVPGLRGQDLQHMPHLRQTVARGDHAPLVPSFPGVTWPVQANMLTGCLPQDHGVVANGFYWRDQQEVEMWTAGNERIERPQIWDLLEGGSPKRSTAAWFPMLSKRCGASYICMPAPIHHPDGSESLWCYSRPTELYGDLHKQLGDFPLQHFWGPLANIRSTAWIAKSAALAARDFGPAFFYIYMPHLDYAAQKFGPDSAEAIQACRDLDDVLGSMFDSMNAAFEDDRTRWLVASEYTIVPVQHVLYPNRILRDAGLLEVRPEATGGSAEQLSLADSRAWALVDHQFSHVFVDHSKDIGTVVDLFQNRVGVSEVLAGEDRRRYGMEHERSGEVIVVSTPDSWQAYYWWMDDALAPSYARSVDIHRKPGYDPVELHWEMPTRSTPLDATLVRGSHGAPAVTEAQRGVLLSSHPGMFSDTTLADTDVFQIVLRQFGQ